MQAKLYVGNLNYSVTESDLQTLFQKYGEIKSVSLISDKYSGQSKGFAFVEMANPADAEKALAENGNEFMGRSLTVSEARPPKRFDDKRGPRGGGGHGGGHGKSFEKKRFRY
ncbi:MAG: RNA-binding protein [Candidatus Omnitrophica bacterium]|nr:RNA-binding protein [Candidatus Omnitrophota bacterium]